MTCEKKNFFGAFLTLCNLTGLVVCMCGRDEAQITCDGNEICYDGTNSEYTAEDVICMLQQENGCDITYLSDTCKKCDKNPKQYTYGSQYMDCIGDCFEPDQTASMKVVDTCGVCGGTNSTCSPKVTNLDVVLIPDIANIIFKITGIAMTTPGIQIVLLSSVDGTSRGRNKRKASSALNEMYVENDTSEEFSVIDGTNEPADEFGNNRLKRAAKDVKLALPVIKVYDETTLEVRAENVPAGVYEVGARTGDDGKEYKDHTGPLLTVYEASDYSVDSLSPTEHDLDGTDTVTVTLQLKSTSTGLSIQQMFQLTGQCKCFFSDNMDAAVSVDATSSVVGSCDGLPNSVECVQKVPQTSKESWVCASFNNQHLVGCQKITFFETAPSPIEDKLTFAETGDGAYIIFNKPVYSEARVPCSAYFTTILPLGRGPKCHFDEEGKTLFVKFGDGNSVDSGDTLELKAGLVSQGGSFKRQSQAVILDLTLPVIVGNEVETESIEIAPRGSWPTMLTAWAKSPIILEIQTLKLLGNRPPESIVWTVNEVEQAPAADQLELELDVSGVGQFNIKVTATDFLGGKSVVSHSLAKEDIDLPTVLFSPLGVKETSSGRFVIHPNTVFIINTKIYYEIIGDLGLEAYMFQWKRNGADVLGGYYYKSTKDETTIDMCGELIVYSIVASMADETSNTVEYSVTMLVACRDPLAIISGNDLVNVDKSHEDITVYGSTSYDPDGGKLTYAWTCSTLGDTSCIEKVTSKMHNSTTSPNLIISPSKMVVGKKYALSLTVSVEKSDKTYNNIDNVIYAIHDGNKPVVRWITMRTKFRHDVPIMVKAHVGTDVVVKWRFIPNLELYDWVDAANTTTGKASRVTEGFAWYTIRAGVLEPGSQYKLEVNVSVEGLVTIEEYDIYIYELLRSCSLQARSLVELEEASISVRNCAQDPDVSWRYTTCTAGDRELHLTQGHSFIVPIFKPGTNSVVISCKIIDSLWHQLVVNSSEVSVTQASQTTKPQDKIAQLKQTGDLLGALAVMAEMADSETDQAVNNEAVGLIDQIISGDPSSDDIRRSLKSFKRLRIDKIRTDEKTILADNLVRMVEKLCSTNPQDGATAFNVVEIKEMIGNARHLMESTRKLGPLYRVFEDNIACIKIKVMQNEDHDSVEFEDGSKHSYLVNTLDDVKDFVPDLEFPEELKSIYRDQWKCGESEMCHGVGLKVEKYISEPPDLLFGRDDQKCKQYVVVDLYNPLSGKRIPVKKLEGTINFHLGNQCPRAQCWYYDEFLKRYSQDGVYTLTRADESVDCQANHLTAFTVRSEPELYRGTNIPYIVAICVGLAGLLVSVVVLVKLLLFTKHQANAVNSVDDEKQLDLDELNTSGEEYPVKKRQ